MARSTALLCALLASTVNVVTGQAQTGRGGSFSGLQKRPNAPINECFSGGKDINVAAGGAPGGKCMFTGEFERYYESFASGSCKGFRDCAGFQDKIKEFAMKGLKGKKVVITKLGLCGEVDQGAGASGFKFTGDKGTPAWVSLRVCHAANVMPMILRGGGLSGCWCTLVFLSCLCRTSCFAFAPTFTVACEWIRLIFCCTGACGLARVRIPSTWLRRASLRPVVCTVC